jgi:hypothetical protein
MLFVRTGSGSDLVARQLSSFAVWSTMLLSEQGAVATWSSRQLSSFAV